MKTRSPKPHLLVFALCAFAFVAPRSSSAGLWVQTGVSALEFAHTDNTISSTDNRLLISPTLGWAFLQGFMIGVQGFEAFNHSNTKSYGLGPKGGVLMQGFEFTGAWLSYVNDVRGSDTRSGKGVVLNLGYSARVVGPIRLGAYFSYFALTYDKENGSSLAPATQESFISPQLAIAFGF